jgi:hypothetical protein
MLVAAGLLAALAADYFVTPVLLHLFRPFGAEDPAVQAEETAQPQPVASPVTGEESQPAAWQDV